MGLFYQDFISTFLQKLGFNLKVNNIGFNGYFISQDGLEINVIYFDSIIGMQVTFKDLTRTIIDSSKIQSVDELVFILSKNVYLKTKFKTLYKEMIQSQTLLNVKHS